MTDISQKTLKLIRKKKLTPTPGWVFTVKNVLFWLLLLFSLLIGSLAFSVVLFMLTSQDWDLHPLTSQSPLVFIILNLPYFWIISTSLLIAFSLVFFKATKKSYKTPQNLFILATFISSLVLGSLFHLAGSGSLIDRFLAESTPVYRQLNPQKFSLWSNPSAGLLSGRITQLTEDGFEITDFSNQNWTIQTDNPTLRGPVRLEVGQEVKLIGSQTDTSVFFAQEIRPWGRGGGRRF